MKTRREDGVEGEHEDVIEIKHEDRYEDVIEIKHEDRQKR
jgi:hypothetical protein